MAFSFRCPIYPIVGDTAPALSPLDIADRILSCGIPLLQLRMKNTPTGRFVEIATELRERCARHGAALIVNDRCDIAALVGADGIHLGQDDLPPAEARKILGPQAIIGHSTHDLAQLERSVADAAVDYVAFGPIFATANKQNPDPVRGLERLRAAASRCPRPLVAIGGIGPDNVAEVLRAGADAAAVIGAITGAAEPAAATRDLLRRARLA